MRTAHVMVLSTLLALLLATRVVLAAPSTQTIAPTAVAAPTSVVVPPKPIPTSLPAPVPSPTIVSISSSPPIAEPETNSTLPVGEAPLSVAQRVSSESAMPGGKVHYTIQIASSRVGAMIETQSLLPPELRLIGASISGGNCNGTGSIICRTTLGQSGGATIEIVAQVLPGAAVGSTIVSQTLAQDDLSYTAASDQTSVTIIAAPVVQNSNVEAAKPAQPAKPEPAPAEDAQPAQPAPGTSRRVGTPQDAPIGPIPALPAADPRTVPPVDRSVPIQDTRPPNSIPEVSGQDEQRVVRANP